MSHLFELLCHKIKKKLFCKAETEHLYVWEVIQIA